MTAQWSCRRLSSCMSPGTAVFMACTRIQLNINRRSSVLGALRLIPVGGRWAGPWK